MVAAGKPKRQAALFVVPDELLEIAYRVAGDRIEAALYTPSKVARAKAVEALKRRSQRGHSGDLSGSDEVRDQPGFSIICRRRRFASVFSTRRSGAMDAATSKSVP